MRMKLLISLALVLALSGLMVITMALLRDVYRSQVHRSVAVAQSYEPIGENGACGETYLSVHLTTTDNLGASLSCPLK